MGRTYKASVVHGNFAAGQCCYVSAIVPADNHEYLGHAVGVSGEISDESDCGGARVEARGNGG